MLKGLVVALFFFSINSQAEVLTFKEWKSYQVLKARQAANKIQMTNAFSGTRGLVNGRDFDAPVSVRARRDLRDMARKGREERQNIERVKLVSRLTVRDYFENYIAEQPDQYRTMNELAMKLSVDEMTELLLDYAQTFR